MSDSLCLVVNPAAGHGRARQVAPHAANALRARGAELTVTESASLAHARELAAAAVGRGETVVAVGGDGLAGALAGVTASGNARYGLIPAGRGNDLARVLGIPSDPAGAAAVITAGHHRRIDLIGVGRPGEPETLVVGSVYAGIPSVANEIANASKGLPDAVVYQIAALRALAAWKPVRFRLSPGAESGDRPGDGARAHDFEGYAVIIANNSYFGAGMLVAPSAAIDDGALDIVLMRQARKATFIRALLKVNDGSHVTLPQVTLDRATDVTLTMSQDLPAAADGETLACAAPLPAGTPLRIRVLPRILDILAPPA